MADERQVLKRAWRAEIQARYVYRVLAQRERDPRRAAVLGRLGDAEASHRQRLEARLAELGESLPDPDQVRISPWLRLQARLAPPNRLLLAREAAESQDVSDIYAATTGSAATDQLLRQIRDEEKGHEVTLANLGPATPFSLPGPQARLGSILGRESWHHGAGSWISDAIYGANDGLAAVFGIVAGVAGATAASSFVLTAGLAGAIASSLSMGVGAFLASRSQTEVSAANRARERRELDEHPDEEKEELSLFYQLKGLSAEEANELVEKLARNPEGMLDALMLVEFGGEAQDRSPWLASIAALISTAIGALVPVVPFFFTHGLTGVVWAAGISLIAHFLVGAAKSVFTLRSWWAAGLEMTLAGVLVGGATYGLGLLFKVAT